MLGCLTERVLLSISSTSPDSTDLGFLLHKHPDRVRSVAVGGGTAHVFYPEQSDSRTTATLFVEVDPIKLSRRSRGNDGPATLKPYVNDRPYVASSMLSVAIGKLFGTALAGSCDPRPELVDAPLDLEVEIPVVSMGGGAQVVASFFEPLGWSVRCTPIPLDETFAGWGASEYGSIHLTGTLTVKDALAHLFVLLPALDGEKHYWIDEDEVDKLLRRGGDWLSTHPEKELISRRYLRFRSLARDALARLSDDASNADLIDELASSGEASLEAPLSLNDQRMTAVVDAVMACQGGSVVDLGCGEGRLLQRLVGEPLVQSLLGVDVSLRSLQKAEDRLHLDDLSERRRDAITLIQGALTYVDERIRGFDIATVIEVIEHLDAERLDAFARVVFGDARPTSVIVTTPNREYNVNFSGLAPGEFRHRDHRFEWTRHEFAEWTSEVCTTYGYSVEFSGIGPDDPTTGPPTQMAVLTRGVAP